MYKLEWGLYLKKYSIINLLNKYSFVLPYRPASTTVIVMKTVSTSKLIYTYSCTLLLTVQMYSISVVDRNNPKFWSVLLLQEVDKCGKTQNETFIFVRVFRSQNRTEKINIAVKRLGIDVSNIGLTCPHVVLVQVVLLLRTIFCKTLTEVRAVGSDSD